MKYSIPRAPKIPRPDTMFIIGLLAASVFVFLAGYLIYLVAA